MYDKLFLQNGTVRDHLSDPEKYSGFEERTPALQVRSQDISSIFVCAVDG